VIRPRTLKRPGVSLAARWTAKHSKPLRFVAALTPLVAGVVAWALSLRSIDTSGLGRYGLPPALPVLWYVALGVLICGAVTVIWAARAGTALIALYVLAVVIVLDATVPAITAVPHYAWVYKHIGVARFIAAHGSVDVSGDIYNRWPGFFAAAAAYARLAGVDPLSYAAWAEPFFAVVETMLVAAVARALAREVRVAAYAALIFALGNWIGQSYFAPQSAAYALALTLLLVFVRAFTAGTVRSFLTRATQMLVRRPQPQNEFGTALPWSRATSIAVVLGLDTAIVVTHQLTPYVLLLQLGALVLIGVARPPWLVAAMGVLTVAYLAPNFEYVARNFGLFTSLDPARNIQHPDSTPAHLDWFHANAGGLLSVFLIVLMLVSAVRLARMGNGNKALSLVVLAIAPFAILFAQNYGGEASLRVFLFSSPWRDVLIALGVQTIARPRVRFVAALATCLVLAYLFIPAFYGAENLNIIPADEVAASQDFYSYAPAGSVLMLSAPDFPTWLGSRYNLMRGPLADDGPNIVGNGAFQDRPLGRKDVPAVIALVRQYSRSGFVEFSTTGYRYAATHELTPPGALRSLERAVAASRQFRMWYYGPDVRIYELID